MKILSHRGYWKDVDEKNSAEAFHRSFSMGFGAETDVRDFNQRLVISHDIATGLEIDFTTFLNIASSSQSGVSLTLALNIKADGLADSIREALEAHPKLDCFVFDMSVPDMRSYFDAGIPVFTRMSEVEQDPVWLERATGVLLDSFEFEWFEVSVIQRLLREGTRVCSVAPELHYRSYLEVWECIKPLAKEDNLLLCTDHTEQAVDFFEYREGIT